MASAAPGQEAAVPLKTWIAVGGALIGAFMAVLNIQITNASLPDIEGGIGTGGINGAWVINGLSDWRDHRHPDDGFPEPGVFAASLSDRQHGAVSMLFRRLRSGKQPVRNDRVACLAGVLRWRADTARLHHRRGDAAARRSGPLGLAGFAITATFAPAIGPTIGGWLTDNYGWQTIFYINIVPGIVMLAALIYGLPRSPMQLGLLRRGDWIGIALMAIGLAALQTVLDEGNGLRLVRLAIHRQTEHSRSDHADGVHRRRTDGEGATGPAWSVQAAQFCLRHAGELPAGLRTLRLSLLAAALPRCLAGIQRSADRRGDGVDRAAAAHCHPVCAALDAPHRLTAAGRPSGSRYSPRAAS